jgi:hypothetical protein
MLNANFYPQSKEQSRRITMNAAPRGDWRELAMRIQNEKNSETLSALVQQLIVAFDREKVHKHSR